MPANEAARVEALRQLQILDTPPEGTFDDLTALAARICEAPMSVISLVDESRQWFKSRVGVSFQQTSREVSFCGHSIMQSDLMIVPDALQDERFAHNPLVLQDPKIRFYAGAPLILREGYAVGTLCIMDYRPRELPPEHQQALRVLSHHLTAQLELRRALAEERCIRQELNRAHEDLEKRVMDRTAQLTVVNDELRKEIAERKRTETALRESERRYRELFENATYGIHRVTVDGNFLDVNPALVAMLGYSSREELLAVHTPTDIFQNPEERIRLIEELRQRQNFKNIESNWKRKDGTPIRVRLSGRTLRESGGKLTGFEVIVEDVTERRQLEEQLLQAQKMEAVGRLAGGIAHDFNNLLGVIKGYTELLFYELQPSAASSLRRVEEIDRAADRATTLTRQLLAFSRRQILAPRVFDLNAIVAETDKMLRRVIGEHIELITRPARKLGNVRADPAQIEQVLVNLAVNARDAMPQGGKLILETAEVELDEGYSRRQPDAAPGRYVVLSVSDTGVGMKAETLSHIFEPFFTTKTQEKGTGLGLATAYGIVKQSGGFIWVHSEPGQGSTFKVYLPLVEEVVEPVAVPPPRPLYSSLRGFESLLLVEDSDLLRELTRDSLKGLGYNVLEAKDGPAALELSRTHAGPIHLLITDVVLPGISGREVAHQVVLSRPGTKVLYVSGYTDETLSQLDLSGDQAAFVQKPFSPRDLAEKVRTLLDNSSDSAPDG